jgi:hypothetical protein
VRERIRAYLLGLLDPNRAEERQELAILREMVKRKPQPSPYYQTWDAQELRYERVHDI